MKMIPTLKNLAQQQGLAVWFTHSFAEPPAPDPPPVMSASSGPASRTQLGGGSMTSSLYDAIRFFLFDVHDITSLSSRLWVTQEEKRKENGDVMRHASPCVSCEGSYCYSGCSAQSVNDHVLQCSTDVISYQNFAIVSRLHWKIAIVKISTIFDLLVGKGSVL